jgi:type IV secretory pathway VirJ component
VIYETHVRGFTVHPNSGVAQPGTYRGLKRSISVCHPIPVVGLNTLRYFCQARTPESAAHDLERIIRRYSAAWQRPKVLLIGYSFGADVLPFLYMRLPDDLRASVRTVNLLGLGDTAVFEFHVSDWIPGSGGRGLPVVPEVEHMAGASVLCLYGADEHDSPCRRLAGGHVKAVSLSGGHHFGGDYPTMVQQIIEHAPR